MTFSKMPGGIRRFFCAYGTCSITGILMGAKYLSLNCPFSTSIQASAHIYFEDVLYQLELLRPEEVIVIELEFVKAFLA